MRNLSYSDVQGLVICTWLFLASAIATGTAIGRWMSK